jgi:mRNA interferase RelE/StbE
VRYTIDISPRARRLIRRLPRDVQTRAGHAIDGLEQDPRPPGVVKMSGYDRRYRVRIGDYRVVYDIFDDRLVILIIEVVHRRDAYR